jgi:hypothetical protein
MGKPQMGTLIHWSSVLVQHGVNKMAILNRQKAYSILFLTFDL